MEVDQIEKESFQAKESSFELKQIH